MRRRASPGLFDSGPTLPEGFRYEPDFLSPDEERDVVRHVETLPFQAFEFQGFLGKRRVVSFGWKYDFNDRWLQKADDMPEFLLHLCRRAAAWAGLDPAALRHALVTEYSPRAGIDWHRDRAVFDEVVGLSLLAACNFRFRRRKGEKWERAAIAAEPRSAYLLSGPSRTEWEHSIPEVDQLRYSITFRTFRAR
jgi:alkylated DNA repair dioxygenase AlkB